MGMRFTYTCNSCGYQSVSSEHGKADRGFFNEVEPMVCADCKEVVQVVTGKAKEMGGEIIEKVEKECPHCKGKNVSAWNGACPKCGGAMNKEGEQILWD